MQVENMADIGVRCLYSILDLLIISSETKIGYLISLNLSFLIWEVGKYLSSTGARS
jgi:hypothetical protein